MKSLFAVLALFGIVTGLEKSLYDSSYYKDDNSGKYIPDNSGQYIHDDSGRYVPDHSGDYKSDGQGGYLHDGSGTYRGANSDNGAYRGETSVIRSNPSNTIFKQLSSNSLLGLGSNQDSTLIKPSVKLGQIISAKLDSETGSVFGNSASATSQILLPLAKTSFSGSNYDHSKYYDDRKWKILRLDGDVASDGYHWEYETENGIEAQESGKVVNKGSNAEELDAQGFFKYTGPDNVVYLTKYRANGNGFVAEGSHLPQPPPIPIGILKGLEYLKSVGKL